MRALRFLAVAIVLIMLAGAFGWWRGTAWYDAPGPAETATTLVLEHRQSVQSIGRALVAAGLIDRPSWFVLAAEATRGDGELKGGEYAFPVQASPQQILAIIRSGRTVVHRLVVPEGLSTAEILARVDAAEALEGAVTESPAEGALMPDTYFYSHGDRRQALVDRMASSMRKLTASLWTARRPDLPLASPADAVTLASIVEKETAIDAERPRIAGVFYNRLARGMRLQSDPTVVYGITGGKAPLGHRLDHDDLAVESPYNTYRVDGLPPGPIDNPGRAALLAVLHPDTTDALYFVADGSGGHAFSATLEGHHQNVDRWHRFNGKPAVKPKNGAS